MDWKEQKRQDKSKKSLFFKRQFNKDRKRWQKEKRVLIERDTLKEVKILENKEGGKVDNV